MEKCAGEDRYDRQRCGRRMQTVRCGSDPAVKLRRCRGFYPEDEYDLAGFAVGVVDEKDLIMEKELKDGDVLIGIASSGVHSNGFSLVRKVFKMDKETLDTYHEELGTTLGEALIAPTKIYVKALRNIKQSGVKIKGCSHITGGGFDENIPRMLCDGVRAVVEKDSYPFSNLPDARKRRTDRRRDDVQYLQYGTWNDRGSR